MSDSQQYKSGGVSAGGLLGVVFVVLKLLGITAVASWSWWWVTLPLWGGIATVAVLGVLILVVVGLMQLVSK